MKKLSIVLLSATVVATLGLSQVGFTQQAYNQSINTFEGTTLYQSGMSLEDADTLASVTAEQALTLVQQKTGNLPEGASAELTLLNGYLVWSVDLGTESVFVDITNPELIVQQQVANEQYNAGESDNGDYESEHEAEHEDDDESEHESEYEDEDDSESEHESEYEDDDDSESEHESEYEDDDNESGYDSEYKDDDNESGYDSEYKDNNESEHASETKNNESYESEIDTDTDTDEPSADKT